MSPISKPDDSAGVSGSMADTTTGFDPCIRKPNSPDSRRTMIVLSVSAISMGKKNEAQINIFLKRDREKNHSSDTVPYQMRLYFTTFSTRNITQGNTLFGPNFEHLFQYPIQLMIQQFIAGIAIQ